MAPVKEKFNLWRDANKGFKSRFMNAAKDPAAKRDDLPDLQVQMKMERGDKLQEARLKRYPSIDVDRDKLLAGTIPGDLEEAEDRLNTLGFRNNPTAYVEVTEENGPDDGSYSRQIVTETGGRLDIPRVTNQPLFFRRVKDQIHLALYELQDEVEVLAHRERSAWLQPARHVLVNDASARRGVRDLRDIWFDEFEEEMPGQDLTNWETSH